MGDDVFWRSPKAPEDLPTLDDIVTACQISGFNRNGVALLVAGQPQFWVKYNFCPGMRGEGLTQAHVAEIVNADPMPVVRIPDVYLIFCRGGITYIVMELVEGKTIGKLKSKTGTYEKEHIAAVVAAVQRLLQIKMPAGTAPGPIGGGRIGHDLFEECLSTLTYPTVGDLEDHLNRVLRFVEARCRVNFKDETTDGLVLCPSDLHDSNFMIDSTGALWAIDFGRTSFLPPSFMYYSLKLLWTPFGIRVARLLQHPPSENFRAMDIAGGQFVIFSGGNSLRAPSNLLKPGGN